MSHKKKSISNQSQTDNHPSNKKSMTNNKADYIPNKEKNPDDFEPNR